MGGQALDYEAVTPAASPTLGGLPARAMLQESSEGLVGRPLPGSGDARGTPEEAFDLAAVAYLI